MNPLDDLTILSEEIFARWDVDMRSGKLLQSLMGRIEHYDERVDNIRQALAAYTRFQAALHEIEQHGDQRSSEIAHRALSESLKPIP